MSVRHLDLLLNPSSVAVIDVSNRFADVGATVWSNLHHGIFAGPIYAVNPACTMLSGAPVVLSPEELPQALDLAVLCTPLPLKLNA